MNSHKIIFLLSVTCFAFSRTEEEDIDYEDVDKNIHKLRLAGATYLEKVMRELENERSQTQIMEMPDMSNMMYTHREHFVPEKEIYSAISTDYNISGPTPLPDVEAEIIPEGAPPLSLSKEELLALYEAALTKAQSLPILQKPTENQFSQIGQTVKPAFQGQMGSHASGYYYYYFPIKSFLKPAPQFATKPPVVAIPTTTPPPQQVHITMVDPPNRKSVEPLFMAISGFIGMALMFLFSVLFVPKFSKIRSKHSHFKETEDEMATFAQIVLQAVAGKDCSERLACEIAGMLRGIKPNNKPLRILEIILPPKLSQKVTQIRKAAGKKAKCGYIPCKMKKGKPPGKNEKGKQPWKKKETPHDIWMKHFEKGKLQQQKVWNRKPPAKKSRR